MKVQNLTINGTSLINGLNKIDWKVYNIPTINITSSDHNHDDRYYRKPEVDSRIESLDGAIDTLMWKIDSLKPTTMLSIDANDSYIETPGMNMDDAFTISFSYNVVGASSGMFYNKEYCYELAMTSDGYLEYALQGPNTDDKWQWVKTFQLNKTNKHWLTFVYDGSNTAGPTIKIYVDGGLEYEETGGIIPSSLNNQDDSGLYFGNRPSKHQPAVGLKIDQIKVYDKVLNEDEIKIILSTDENKIRSTDHLQLFYNFEDPTDRLKDLSPNNNNATAYGTVSYELL